ncbi:CpaF family protein [Ruicaihuangia caeni]|uniref:CpaF family protein n=1 Tax=Ruicaihuangia caeni TaxID=3042517 RepID=UPI0033905F59
MVTPVSAIAERVRSRLQTHGVDVSGDPDLAQRYVDEELRRYGEAAMLGNGATLSDERSVTRGVLSVLTGFGPLQPLLDDPEIEEIWINAPDAVFVARAGVAEPAQLVLDEHQVPTLVERMLQSTGRRIDLASPFVDASLPDGSRLHVVIPSITRRHWAVNIRKFTQRISDVHQLVEAGSLTAQAAEFLRMCVLSGHNVLVSGATQSGKTTMLNALLSACRPEERVITVEETFELSFGARDTVAMQCRAASVEGSGEVTLRRLIKEALRMRPDRLVVGEVREAESLDLLIALNSGLPGMCSIHANSANDALAKLATLPLLAGRNIDSTFVVPTVARCIDVVVHCELARDGSRRVVEIIAPTGRASDGEIEAEPIFRRREGRLQSTGIRPARAGKFEVHGFDVEALLGAEPGGDASR